MIKAVIIDGKDNVATVLGNAEVGEDIQLIGQDEISTIRAIFKIPRGHKISIRDIEKGGPVMKYGEVIGKALVFIKKGEHVHIHNMDSIRGKIFK